MQKYTFQHHQSDVLKSILMHHQDALLLACKNNRNVDLFINISEVDECFARARKELAQIVTTGAPTLSPNTISEFLEGETVFQVGNTYGEYTNIDEATATGQVINWNSQTLQLTLGNITGSFVTSATTSAIKGTESNAERFVGGTGNADFFSQINSESETLQGDNEDLQLEVEQDNLIDFSDRDPFSGGNY